MIVLVTTVVRKPKQNVLALESDAAFQPKFHFIPGITFHLCLTSESVKQVVSMFLSIVLETCVPTSETCYEGNYVLWGCFFFASVFPEGDIRHSLCQNVMFFFWRVWRSWCNMLLMFYLYYQHPLHHKNCMMFVNILVNFYKFLAEHEIKMLWYMTSIEAIACVCLVTIFIVCLCKKSWKNLK